MKSENNQSSEKSNDLFTGTYRLSSAELQIEQMTTRYPRLVKIVGIAREWLAEKRRLLWNERFRLLLFQATEPDSYHNHQSSNGDRSTSSSHR